MQQNQITEKTDPFLWVYGTPLPEASQNQGREKPKDSKNVESVLKNSGRWPNYSSVSKKQSKAATLSNSFICLLVFETFVFTKNIQAFLLKV